MPLKYFLRLNPFKSDSGDYMAVSISPQSYDLEDIIEEVTREGSTITTAEAMANFMEITRAIKKRLRQGASVNTPLVNISSVVKGDYDSEEDVFDPERHWRELKMNPGKDMRDVPSQISVEKIEPTDRRPGLQHYHDHASQTRDAVITPGGGARITGELLKFDEDDPEQGVFFINTGDQSVTKVEEMMLRNKPGTLIFINPGLPAGTYRLEVRGKARRAPDVRTGTLSGSLTVTE